MGSTNSKNEVLIPKLLIKSKIWYHDTTNLFDYDTKSVHKSKCLINDECSLFKTVYSIEKDVVQKSSDQKNIILDLLFFRNHFWIYRIGNINETIQTTIWQNAKFTYYGHNKKPGYKIELKNILKFGKIILEVKEIRIVEKSEADKFATISNSPAINVVNENSSIGINNNSFVNQGNNNSEVQDHHEEKESGKHEDPEDPENPTTTQLFVKSIIKESEITPKPGDEDKFCRVCLSPQTIDTDPLISPCKCAGSMKFIHLNCLFKWLTNKGFIQKLEHCILYTWNSFECELCKEKLPSQFLVEGKMIALYEIEKPSTSYFILESPQISTNSNSLTIICSFKNKNSLKFGRESDNDIKLLEISVSRHHCKFSIENDSIILEDTKSKYGTLIKADKPIELIPGNPFAVQIGNTLVKGSYTQEFSCCEKKKYCKIPEDEPNDIRLKFLTYLDNRIERQVLYRENTKYIELDSTLVNAKKENNDKEKFNNSSHVEINNSSFVNNENLS